MKEIWKDIKDYEDLYQVSNLGNVKSLKREKYIPSLNKKVFLNQIKTLKPSKAQGYLFVILTKNKIRKVHKIHRLVAETFIKNNKNKKCVNHKDGNKLNNNVNNLEWCSHSENTKHAYKNNLIAKKCRKINQYDINGKFIKQWDSMKQAGEELKINYQNISMCCRGIRKKTYNYIWRYANDNTL